MLAELAYKHIADRVGNGGEFLEIGSGSGAISIYLLKKLNKVLIVLFFCVM